MASHVTSIRIDEDLKEIALKLASERGLSFSGLVEIALDRYIRAQNKLGLFQLAEMEVAAIAEIENGETNANHKGSEWD